jgi:hypothetical protein
MRTLGPIPEGGKIDADVGCPSGLGTAASNSVKYLRSAVLWLLLAGVVEAGWVFADPTGDPRYGRPLALPYNVALVLLAGVAPALAKHRYLVWLAAAMPLWILIVVVIGAWHG